MVVVVVADGGNGAGGGCVAAVVALHSPSSVCVDASSYLAQCVVSLETTIFHFFSIS